MPVVVLGAVAAGAAVSVGVAVSTVAMVGLGATVVGKITKSKELMQFGSGLGLGAGIASVATSVFGATSAAAGTAEAGSAALENTISSADLAGIDAAAGGIGGSAPGALSISTAWDAPATAIEAAGSTSGLPSTTGGLLGSSSTAPAVPAQQAAVDVSAPAAAPAPASGVNAPVAPPAGTDTNSIKQWWAKQPEGVKNKILQMGGSAVGGLFDGWSAEQKLALQREQQNLEKQKYETAMANGSAQPRVQFQPYKPAATGLLGSTKG